MSSLTHRTQLSVNVNKVALLRNSRHLGIPSVTRAAERCLAAGAHGITVHPRPDERHIRAQDVQDLADLLRQTPDREFNIEGNPTQNLMAFIWSVRPQQATFVPDTEVQLTSDHGWSLPRDQAVLQPLIAECHALGVRVSLFMDAVPEQMVAAKNIGADRVELYTGPYAWAYGTATQLQVMAKYVKTAQAALSVGLVLNAGHDLNLDNLTGFLQAVPGVSEVSIGHAFIADALEMGYGAAVGAYLSKIEQAATVSL